MNNSIDFETITRRARAEGIDMNLLKDVLKDIHVNAEHGISHDVVDDGAVVAYYGSPEYKGGYMYRGWSVLENGILPKADILETRWSNAPTSAPTTSKEDWEAAVKAAGAGAKLELTCSMEYVDHIVLVKVAANKWSYRRLDGKFSAIERDMGVTLYEGIREEVAGKMEVECSSTFHQCFDVVVEELINRPC